MTLSGAVALQRPDVDRPAPLLPPSVIHELRPMDSTGRLAKYTRTAREPTGTVSETTGSFIANVNTMTEHQRRAQGLRRNGQTRRRR